MNLKNLFEIECLALTDLVRSLEWRANAEKSCRETYETAKLQANKEVNRARKTIAADRERDVNAIMASWEEARQSIKSQFDAKQDSIDRLYQFTMSESKARAKAEEDKTQSAYSDAVWTADSLFEAAEKESANKFDVLRRKAVGGSEAIEKLWQLAVPLLDRGGLKRESFAAIRSMSFDHADLLERMDAAIAYAEVAIERLAEDRSVRMVGGLGHLLVRSKARRVCEEIGNEIGASLAAADQARQELLQKAALDHKNRVQEARRFRDGSKIKAQDKYPPLLLKISKRCQAEIAVAADKHERDTEKLRKWNYEFCKKRKRTSADRFANATTVTMRP